MRGPWVGGAAPDFSVGDVRPSRVAADRPAGPRTTDAMIESRARSRTVSMLLRWAPPMVVGAVFAHGLASSWLKWGSLLVDTGRELQLPQRMLAGEVLYSDLRYYHRPPSPYVEMLVYRGFGVPVEG